MIAMPFRAAEQVSYNWFLKKLSVTNLPHAISSFSYLLIIAKFPSNMVDVSTTCVESATTRLNLAIFVSNRVKHRYPGFVAACGFIATRLSTYLYLVVIDNHTK
jgi:hypothetical protein